MTINQLVSINLFGFVLLAMTSCSKSNELSSGNNSLPEDASIHSEFIKDRAHLESINPNMTTVITEDNLDNIISEIKNSGTVMDQRKLKRVLKFAEMRTDNENSIANILSGKTINEHLVLIHNKYLTRQARFNAIKNN